MNTKFISPILNKFGFFRDFRASFQYETSRKSVQWERRWYKRKNRLTDITKLRGAFREYEKAPKMAV